MPGACNGAKLTGPGVHGCRHALLAIHHGRNPDAVLCPRHQICGVGGARIRTGVRAAPGWVALGRDPPHLPRLGTRGTLLSIPGVSSPPPAQQFLHALSRS